MSDINHQHGAIGYLQLPARDIAASLTFYREVFGWSGELEYGSFTAPGLTATEELSAVAVIDVGKPTAAILYVSIPGTHKQFDHVVDEVLNSVRPL